MSDLVEAPAPAAAATPAPVAASSSSSFGSVISSVLAGVDNSIFAIVMGVAAAWFPQLANCTAEELTVIGNNFRAFLSSISQGTPWGTALADMLTADWNEVKQETSMLAIDFASDVATALETLGLLPQGKGN